MTMTDPVSPDLRRHLRALKLGQLTATLPERLVQARQQKMPHADFLELLLSDEVTRRENGSADRRARAAGLAPDMRLDSWDPSAAVRYDQQLWNELATLRFAEAGHGALILGPPVIEGSRSRPLPRNLAPAGRTEESRGQIVAY